MSARRIRFTTVGTRSWTGQASLNTTVRDAIISGLQNNGWSGGTVSLSPAGVFQNIISITFNSLDCYYDAASLATILTQIVQGTGYFDSVPQFTIQEQGAECNQSGGGLGIGGGIGGGSGSTYTVRSGDTMSAIAARFNMTLAQLMALNPQIRNANVISVGQLINVSGSGGGSLGIGGSIGGLVNLITGVNPSTGQVTATPTPVVNQQGAPPPKEKDDRNWFDKTFFDGAGALTGTAIGVLVVLGAIVVAKSQQE